jgi:hypothetical protein
MQSFLYLYGAEREAQGKNRRRGQAAAARAWGEGRRHTPTLPLTPFDGYAAVKPVCRPPESRGRGPEANLRSGMKKPRGSRDHGAKFRGSSTTVTRKESSLMT